ncbi:MAG: hypothetical protein A2521_02395 [Deltaproteobacteria bacterium RIFOXYD12_FULL_57_12]|nr:MAG: hypothetical protein A2521_02395 [Deltaproteobacteria bacterium RIFOXYD12_FULL_57_12]
MPVRLIILVFLLYILFRLLTGGKKRAPRPADEQRGPAGPAQDVLVEDPVCRTYIPRGQSVQLFHEHQMYYFCSQKCCQTFLTNKEAKK